MTDTKKQILDLRENSTRQRLYHRHSSSLKREVVEMFTETEQPKKTTHLFRNLEGPVQRVDDLVLYSVAAAKSLQSCLTLCDPIDGSPPGSHIPGILQARILEWGAISFSNACMHAKLLQSCLTLCDPMDSSPPGSSVHGILQSRIPEWVAISFSSSCLNQLIKVLQLA